MATKSGVAPDVLTDEDIAKFDNEQNPDVLTDEQMAQFDSENNQAQGESFFSQPDVEKRSGVDLFLNNTAAPDSNAYFNLAKRLASPKLSDFLTPMNALSMPEIIGATVQTPAIKSLIESSGREEALGANILRKANEKGDLGSVVKLTPSGIVADAINKGSVVDLLHAGGKALTGQEISTYGNFLKDIGADDFSAATGGFLMSMIDPINVAMGEATKGLKFGSKVKVADSFINRPKGAAGAFSELVSKATGIKRESVETVMTEGAKKVLNGDYDENVFRNISNRITNGLNRLKDNAGKEVGRIKDELMLGDKKIDGSRLKMQLSKEMEKFGFNKERQFLNLSGLADDAGDLKNTMDQILEGEITVNKILDFREQLGNIAYKGFVRGGQKQIVEATDKAKAVIRAWRHHMTQQLHDIAPDLKKADQNFVGATKLREKAAKFFDTASSGERFLRNLDNEGVTVSDKKLLRQTVRRITGSDEWVQRVRHNLARKGFQDFLPTSSGSRLMAGIAGASAGGAAIINPLAGLTLAGVTAATSPRAWKVFLKTGEGGIDLMDNLLRTGAASSARKVIADLKTPSETE